MTTAVDLLLAAASRHADRPAIEPADGPALSYGALFGAAQRLGAELSAGGIGRGDVIGLELDRSVEWVIAALGCWLAGAAFLPLGPELPAARRALMIAKAGARRVLDAAAVATLVRDGAINDLPVLPRRDDLAYVVFTSGSSGAPKGVEVTHRGLAALLRAQIEAFALDPTSRALWLHAPIFDASISDVGTALAAGATLVLAPAEVTRAPSSLRLVLEGRAITHVDLPTALLRFLDPARLPASLRAIVLGGEACPVDAVRALATRVRVVVVYGPTEATVCSSLVVVEAATWCDPLIGAPLPGVRYVIIDGELHIGGDCLARGYAADPAETAARFVDHVGERLYRTGDRVEELAGGALLFRGRVDRQVKLAGRRVELDEIEAVLRTCAGVRDAAVTVRPPDRLAAFVVGEVGDVRAFLAERLPAWMVPAAIEIVPALPRTATGKVDHAALVRRPATGAGRFADPIAAELAPLWCAALGVAAVDPGDRFAASGGDSLSQLALIAAAEARGLPLSAALLDDDPTFATLAQRLRAAGEPPPVTVAEAEARAPAVPGRATPAPPDRAGAVLFTGATGLLGARLLAAWRARDRRPIVCLVRGRDDESAHARLAAAAGDLDGVEVIRADLALPRLGLGEETWSRLADRVSTVIHAAGVVHLAHGWDALAPVNVGATVELSRLIVAGRPKAWHHVSSLSVFASTDRAAGRHLETDRPAADAIVHGGYAQTKIAAEAIARARRGHATPLTIHRLGLLTGSAAADQQLGMTLRGLARLGAVPAGAGTLRLDITPVDHAAAAVAALAVRAEALAIDEVHHIASATGATLDDLATALRAAGAPIEERPAPQWARDARAGFADPDIAMAYLALGRAHAPERARLRPFDLFLATDADFAAERTDGLLAELGVPPPAIDAAMLRHLAVNALAAQLAGQE